MASLGVGNLVLFDSINVGGFIKGEVYGGRGLIRG
jgi:hypothetical protein